jgi:hypothetical protein
MLRITSTAPALVGLDKPAARRLGVGKAPHAQDNYLGNETE